MGWYDYFERMIDSGEAVTVIVSSEKFIILTEPTGKMDLPACDAEANWVAFQISCANVSSLDNQARALYIVALMENSWSSETAGFGSFGSCGSSGSWARRPAHIYFTYFQ